MSVLYLTFIPLPPPPQPRSRTASSRGRIRSREVSNNNSRSASRNASPPPAVRFRDEDFARLSRVDDATSAANGQAGPSRSTSPSSRRASEPPRDVTKLPGWKALVHCAGVVALCRVRDAMGRSMDPMMGLLKSALPLVLENVSDYSLKVFIEYSSVS